MIENSGKTYTQRDIEILISNEAEESVHLEFKSGEAYKLDSKGKFEENSKKELSKDVCSFANSDGGLIVYGLSESNHKAATLSFINGDVITKEFLEQVINSRVFPKIDNLLIEPIRFDGQVSKTVYVINIPKSKNSPHMASDNRYYKRYNFKADIMEEYEVRNLYNKSDKTKLELILPLIKTYIQGQSAGKPNNLRIHLQFNIQNKSQAIEKLFKLDVRLPKIMAMNSLQGQDFFRNHVRHEEKHILYSFPNKSPIFQNELYTITSVDLNVNKSTFGDIIDNDLILMLFYSNGVEEKCFKLSDYVFVEDKLINEADLVY